MLSHETRIDMLSDETVDKLEAHVEACNAARETLERALDDGEALGAGASPERRTEVLDAVAAALKQWQSAQQAFMTTVDASEVSDPAMAALLLKNNEGIDATNARRGLPGAHVEGTDQPFDIDLTGTRGQLLTEAATEHLPASDS